MTANSPIVRATIAAWQERLLQLDRRNNLLYFKASRTSVPIIRDDPDGFVSRLSGARGGLSFAWAERRKQGRRTMIVDDVELLAPTADDYLLAGDIEADCPPVELQRRLTALQKRDREWLEEQGVNVLFLAVGFLAWVDVDGERTLAPLLLVPCDLVRASPRDHFYLTREDDDVVTNATLRYHLSNDQGLELPEFDEDGQSIDGYLNAVADLIEKRPGWVVEKSMTLATFQFSKLPMWEDLDKLRAEDDIAPLVCALAGERDAAQGAGATGGAVYDRDLDSFSGGALDDEFDPREQLLILPADASQLLAIAHARSGQHLVIHGPPGTGKSQTIANIIGALIADRKSVLFVSEKTAALDVVKRRLESSDLGMFCLDLHSERGRKASVYQQLRDSMVRPRAVNGRAFDYDGLLQRRAQLNKVARALHSARQPLGLTVFEVQARLAAVREAPDILLDVAALGALTQSKLLDVAQTATRLAARDGEFREHASSPWLPLNAVSNRLTLADELRSALAVVPSAISAIASPGEAAAQLLGVSKPTSVTSAESLSEILGSLESNPGPVPRSWFADGAISRLSKVAELEFETQNQHAGLVALVAPFTGDSLPKHPYAALGQALQRLATNPQPLQEVLGPDWSARLAARQSDAVQSMDDLANIVPKVESALAAVAELLGEQPPTTRSQASELLSRGRMIESLAPVPAAWLSEGQTGEQSDAALWSAQAASEALASAETTLLANYQHQFVDAVDQNMLLRYRTDYRSFFGRLKGQFRADQRTVQGWCRSSSKPSVVEASSAIEAALDIRSMRVEWEHTSARLQAELGRRFNGQRTDWAALRANFEATRALLSTGQPPSGMRRSLGGEPAELRTVLDRARDGMAQLASAERRLGGAVAGEHEALRSVLSRADSAAEAVTDIRRLIDGLFTTIPGEFADVGEALTFIRNAAHLSSIELDADSRQTALRVDFGERFQHFETDWDAVRRALNWSKDLASLAGSARLEAVASHASRPLEAHQYLDARRAIDEGWGGFAANFAAIERWLRPELTSWGSWREAPFEALDSWAFSLSSKADEASGWLQYLDLGRELEAMVGEGVLGRIRRATDSAEAIPAILERRLLTGWLEDIYAADPELRNFASADQQLLVKEFKQLDVQSASAARNEIRQRVFDRYPSRFASAAQAGEVATLNGQLSRKRRQMPVRALLRNIPNLVQALKPCFLMSPLAVSQHLPRSPLATETLAFDTVIFDEASQVFPEDAIPAIARAKQVIVVGDAKQLPPTSFFRKSMDDDDEPEPDDDMVTAADANALKDRESILEALKGMIGGGVGERHLQVHYRSRHEDMIHFSNHEFYEDRLVVFPSPHISADNIGVRDRHVPAGLYAASVNPVEAAVVVDLVFDLMRTRPLNETIGVVALSRPQADRIAMLIDERRILERDVDGRFTSDRVEPFFVKNLENVQGDERDHIILSVGYGPTAGTTKVMNRFGPISGEGGGRRLNVAITRARQSMTLVHSLRASDITSAQSGAQLLKRYIEFAENPATAIEARQAFDMAAETESPFEAAVKRALETRGHLVQPQVGVAGYRIDLAIYAPDQSRFDLAVECDGYMYHRSPAARDRDWLRQEILEDLGWAFCRIWSTAWTHNPEAELARVEDALARARQGRRPGVPQRPADAPTSQDDFIEPEVPPIRPAESEMIFEIYEAASLSGFRSVGILSQESPRTLAPMVAEVAKVEGPVHFEIVMERLRARYAVARAGQPSRDAVVRAIRAGIVNARIVAERGKSEEDVFISTPGQSPVPRRPLNGGAKRPVAHISPSELEAGGLAVARALFSVDRDGLRKETCRQFGFDRMGPDIRGALEEAITKLVARGELVDILGNLSAPQTPSGS